MNEERQGGLKNSPWTGLIVCSFLLLFTGLGARALWGSEDRWAEVVREMFVTGDFLHPRINWIPYFDKPLLSYWFIAIFAWLKGGAVNELIARIPSAIAGLGALTGTMLLAWKVAGRRTAFLSAWILLTAYSFAFWGRTAAADMENMAFIVIAAAWYFARRDKTDFLSYFLFWVICALGGQTKGLGAIVVPAILVAIDMLLSGSWKKHISIKSIIAAIAGGLVYLLPFIVEAATRGDYSSSGLQLVFKENILRFFQPFDHAEAWYVYFIYVPLLFLPWTPLLALAIAWAAKEWKKLSQPERWICLSALSIFVIFTLSGSRRNYYILPILPFCAIICAIFLERAGGTLFERILSILFKLFDIVIPAFCIAIAFSPFTWGILKAKTGFVPPPGLSFILSVSAILTLALWLAMKLKESRLDAILPSPYPAFARTALSSWLILYFLYAGVLNTCDSLRTAKAFCHVLKGGSIGLKPESLVFYLKAPGDTIFYLGLKGKATVLEDDPKDADKPLKASEKLEALMRNLPSGGILLISERRYMELLPDEIKSAAFAPPIIEEPSYPWEKRKDLARKLVARRICPVGK